MFWIGLIAGIIGTLAFLAGYIYYDIYYSKSDWKNVTIKDGANEKVKL